MDIDDVIRELRARNEPVPIPTRLPSAEEVEAAELRLGIPFPAAFRHYLLKDLLKASDVACGVVEPVTITLPGSHTDLFKVVDRAWNDFGVPRNLLPFCEDNADFYCMNSDGEVVFWSHNGWPSQKWSNLADWIEQVWLNDLDGP